MVFGEKYIIIISNKIEKRNWKQLVNVVLKDIICTDKISLIGGNTFAIIKEWSHYNINSTVSRLTLKFIITEMNQYCSKW